MKAWTLISHGDPYKAFVLRDRPDPEPRDEQVVIRAEGFGVNYADVMAARGMYREAPPLPSVIGYEMVGRVERCGGKVPAGLLGRRVLAITRFGGYAELAATDHRALAPIPDDMPLGEACALATQGATAWYMSQVLCPLRTGQRVLVHAAAGGVGQLLVQLALHAGCEVFAIASGTAKVERLKAMGAHHVVDRHTSDYAEALRGMMKGDRLDVSFNAVGGSTFRKDLRLLGSGGRLVLYGGSERAGIGPFGTLRFVWRMGLVVPIFLMMRSRSLLGVNMLKLGDQHPEVVAECLHGAVEAWRQGVLKPHVHQQYPSGQLPEAHAVLASGRTMGKVVLHW